MLWGFTLEPLLPFLLHLFSSAPSSSFERPFLAHLIEFFRDIRLEDDLYRYDGKGRRPSARITTLSRQ
jgi:hypothetical protein